MLNIKRLSRRIGRGKAAGDFVLIWWHNYMLLHGEINLSVLSRQFCDEPRDSNRAWTGKLVFEKLVSVFVTILKRILSKLVATETATDILKQICKRIESSD